MPSAQRQPARSSRLPIKPYYSTRPRPVRDWAPLTTALAAAKAQRVFPASSAGPSLPDRVHRDTVRLAWLKFLESIPSLRSGLGDETDSSSPVSEAKAEPVSSPPRAVTPPTSQPCLPTTPSLIRSPSSPGQDLSNLDTPSPPPSPPSQPEEPGPISSSARSRSPTPSSAILPNEVAVDKAAHPIRSRVDIVPPAMPSTDFAEGIKMLQQACRLMVTGLEPTLSYLDSLQTPTHADEISQSTLKSNTTVDQHSDAICAASAVDTTDHESAIAEPALSRACSPSSEMIVTPLLGRSSPDRLTDTVEMPSASASGRLSEQQQVAGSADLVAVRVNSQRAIQQERQSSAPFKRRSQTSPSTYTPIRSSALVPKSLSSQITRHRPSALQSERRMYLSAEQRAEAWRKATKPVETYRPRLSVETNDPCEASAAA